MESPTTVIHGPHQILPHYIIDAVGPNETMHQHYFADLSCQHSNDFITWLQKTVTFLGEDEIDAVKSLTKEVSVTSGSKMSDGGVGLR